MALSQLKLSLTAALERRETLLSRLADESTDTYRLFHGTSEGQPGLTVDRYGPQLIVQSFHDALEAPLVDLIRQTVCAHLGLELDTYYNDRSADHSRRQGASETVEGEAVCRELGVRYQTRAKHPGQDPLLFLDFRAARRFMLAESRDLSVLNLFAYSCGMGVCAAVGGAREVLNVDFARSALEVGRENMRLNGLDPESAGFLLSDYFPAARQLAGLPVKYRRRSGVRPTRYPQLQARQFDLVVLDPPRWAKSRFGTVDLIRDYASVFKPALLATRPGGRLLCTNNVAKVALDEWLDGLQRSARKAGRPIRDVQLVEPEEDFPSFDANPPLKIAVLSV